MSKKVADIEEDLLTNVKSSMKILTELESELQKKADDGSIDNKDHALFRNKVVDARDKLVSILHLVMEEAEAIEEYDKILDQVRKGLE